MSDVISMPTDIDRRLAATVKALATGQARDIGDVARTIGISRGALYQKLAARAPFKASEVAQLAELFGVRIEEIYDGLGGRFGPPRAPLATGSNRVLPRLDSNQEPTDNRPIFELIKGGMTVRRLSRRSSPASAGARQSA